MYNEIVIDAVMFTKQLPITAFFYMDLNTCRSSQIQRDAMSHPGWVLPHTREQVEQTYKSFKSKNPDSKAILVAYDCAKQTFVSQVNGTVTPLDCPNTTKTEAALIQNTA